MKSEHPGIGRNSFTVPPNRAANSLASASIG